MKLTDLDPRWIASAGVHFDEVSGTEVPEYLRVGLSFLCPHCRLERVSARFNPPLDPNGNPVPLTTVTPGIEQAWQRVSGRGFADLTLAPELELSEHWRGSVINGEVI